MFGSNTKWKISMLAALIAGASPAYAGTLGGGSAYLNGQTGISCRVVNLGTTSITVTGQTIWEAGSVLPNTSTCAKGTVLGQGGDCDFFATISAAHSHSCQFSYSGTDKDVRGTLDLSGTGTTTDLIEEMR